MPRLEDLTQDPGKAGEFEWAGWSDLRRWRRGWTGNGLIGPDGGTLIITRPGEWLGLQSGVPIIRHRIAVARVS